MIQKKIYYWSPFLSPIATSKAVINSASSLVKFDKIYDSYILNFFGEFSKFDYEIKKNKVKLLNYFNFNLAEFLPYKGKIKSRISFLLLFILGFYPLVRFLKRDKPEYLIIHLITSLPMVLLLFFSFETKFILRISGYPKMNFLRKILWKMTLKKIYLVTCPTKNTLEYIKSLNLTDSSKIKLLYDPIINVNEITKKRDNDINIKDYYLSVGRLTKQKNLMFLCEAFKKLVKQNDELKLVIAGIGEEESNLKRFIKENNLKKNIILLGYVQNIYPYFKNSKGFILTSLWEDPGFVLIEASFCRTLVLSSNSWPGPIELIKDKFNGIVFESNNIDSFIKKFKNFENIDNIKEIKLNNLKQSKKFTLFSHYKNLSKLI